MGTFYYNHVNSRALTDYDQTFKRFKSLIDVVLWVFHSSPKIHFRSNTCETAENTTHETQQKKVVKPIDVSFFLYPPL